MEVIVMAKARSRRTKLEEAALKRLAIQIAAQLPEVEEDALAVLEHAKTLVRSFLGRPGTNGDSTNGGESPKPGA
jgi:hypothetical protein